MKKEGWRWFGWVAVEKVEKSEEGRDVEREMSGLELWV